MVRFKADLLDLIESAHAHGLHVYADLVFNHDGGADAQEPNPIDGQLRWTKFTLIPVNTRRGTASRSATCPDLCALTT